MNRLALLSTLVLATALTSATPTPQTDSATAKIEPLKISYTLSGTFVPAVYHDIQLQTREVTGAKVLWAAPHGQIVRKGDALIRLDTEDIERIIRDKALALELAEIDLKLAIELNRLREFNTPRDIAFHKRAATRTKDDYLSFVNTFRKLEERNVEIDRKSADYSLLSAQEELAQLKKMYAADDLAEETEEMLLKRQVLGRVGQG